MGAGWPRPWASRSFTSPSATPRSPTCRSRLNEFVNTWSVDGFVSEGAQPAELGWGTHEKHFPADGGRHTSGLGLRDLLEPSGREHPGAHLDAQGRAFSRLLDHAFRGDFARRLLHRAATASGWCTGPTTHYAYHPSDNAVLSVHEFAGRNWHLQDTKRIMLNEITGGHRRARRAARRTQEECLLVRLAAVDRGGAQIGAVQQRHQPAGHRRGALRHDLGHGKSAARHRRAGRDGLSAAARTSACRISAPWSARTPTGRRCISAASCSPRISIPRIPGSSRTFGVGLSVRLTDRGP